MDDMMKVMILIFLVLLLVSVVYVFAVRSGSASEIILDGSSRQTVILIHGLGRTKKSMTPLIKPLEKRGYRVENINYPSTRLPIEQLASEYLAPVVEKAQQKSEKVHFVTHSMGGIVLRQYLDTNSPEKIGRIVMLAPPNKGSEVIDHLRGYSLFQKTMGPAALQLSTDAESLPNTLGLIPFETGVVAGDSSFNPLFSNWLGGVDDGKVSVSSSRLDGLADHLVMNVGHTFIMRRTAVVEQILSFLENGKFRR